MDRTVDQASTGAQREDWEKPLDKEVRGQQDNTFNGLHKVSFHQQLSPSDMLYAKNYRGLRGKSGQNTPLAKVRTASQAALVMGKVSKTPLGGGWNLTNSTDTPEAQLPDNSFVTVLQLLQALQSLCNTWAQTGTQEVDSKRVPGAKARGADLAQCLYYHAFVMLKCMEHPGTQAEIIEWAAGRDSQTRAAARQLWIEGWPWGEAMREATEKQCAVLWTLSTTGVASAQQAVLPESLNRDRSPRRPAASSQEDQELRFSEICRDHNTTE